MEYFEYWDNKYPTFFQSNTPKNEYSSKGIPDTVSEG